MDSQLETKRGATPDCALASSAGYISESPPANSERSEANSKWDGCAMFRSAHVEWGTPPDLYAALDREFHFTLDPCAPGGVWDGREVSWEKQRVFCNPPYGRKAKIERWLSKGREAECAVFLLPARTDTNWFHDYALKADEIRFIRGRLKFCENHRICPKEKWLEGAPFPSMLVVFHNGAVAPATQKYNDGSELPREL